ncbi:hypothetical protein GQ43DRAFT_400911 [Delitschia confertaspora ATCC 74209]|uniref:Uncharacterized protein n=1 Tax=Delitschia confertaspora ATCC 74209 TaxID=1513339 RepID=A0A9P4JKZ9_9PLEO|nr:hypothetical protein GQ43DRAFT_400911 [Delitschia confertaspora ATCC 74209]
MLYSSVLVLSTLAIGQAAAGHVKHASFHTRRTAEQQKRSAEDAALITSVDWKKAVDWTKVDYSNVNWAKVNYGGENKGSSSETAPSSTAPPVISVPSVAKQQASNTPTPVVTPASFPSPPASASASPSTSASSSKNDDDDDGKKTIGDVISDIGDFVDGLVDDIKDWFADLDICSLGENSKHNNGKIWLGDSGDYTATFKNNYNEAVILVCWNSQDFTVNTKTPLITVKLPKGKKQTLSFGGISGGCAAAHKGMAKSEFGGLKQTWFEFTFGGQFPTFDVSREPNMKGISIAATAKKSGCTSDMETCVFQCVNGGDTCGQAGEYKMFNVQGKNCHHSEAMTDGGCMMDNGGDHVDVSFS